MARLKDFKSASLAPRTSSHSSTDAAARPTPPISESQRPQTITGELPSKPARTTVELREYGFDSFFCRPGIEGAHEKGGVEGEIGRFRRRRLVPVPTVTSLAALNELIATGDRLDDDRVVTGRPITIGAAFATEASALMGLPGEPFDCARLLHARVDNRARVSVRQCFYSVPVRYAGRRLPVRLAARTVEIHDGPTLVARHERAVGRYVEVLALDHYLEVLKTKPGALPGATALAQAKTCGVFTTSHQSYWDAARRARGDAAGTRALIAILLAHRSMPTAALRAAMDRAVTSGCLDPRRYSSTPAATPVRPHPWPRSARWPATTDRHQL